MVRPEGKREEHAGRCLQYCSTAGISLVVALFPSSGLFLHTRCKSWLTVLARRQLCAQEFIANTTGCTAGHGVCTGTVGMSLGHCKRRRDQRSVLGEALSIAVRARATRHVSGRNAARRVSIIPKHLVLIGLRFRRRCHYRRCSHSEFLQG